MCPRCHPTSLKVLFCFDLNCLVFICIVSCHFLLKTIIILLFFLVIRFRERDKQKGNILIDVQEQELKIKYDYLLSELYDMLGLAKLMAGNLECVVYIRKNCLKTIELTKKRISKIMKIFL